MRVLIWSAPPWERTGYGVGARHLTQLLSGEHQVAVSPMTRVPVDLEWEGIRVLANRDPDMGKAGVVDNFRRFRADLLLPWFDAWLLDDFLVRAGLSPAAVIYSGVDHRPLSPRSHRAVQGALAVVPYCRWAQQVYREAGIEAAEPIPHGVDTGVFRPLGEEARQGARQALGIPQDAFVLGINAANIGPRKNIPGMMRAFRLFLEGRPEAKGRCPEPDEGGCYLLVWSYPVVDATFPDGYDLHQVWQALGGPAEGFRCPTPERYREGLSDEGMAQWYHAIDVLLHCALGEGFGFPILEAMACGVPAIATRFSSMEELVAGRGWLVEVADMVAMQHLSSFMAVPSTRGMVSAMADAHAHPDKRRRLGRRAWRFAQEHDWALVGQRWLALLASLEGVRREVRPLNMEFLSPWRLGLIPQGLPDGAPRRVLDVGSGRSRPYRPHLEHLGEYVAVDIRGGDGILQGDMRALPFGDGEFGFVWASEVLEHLDSGWERAVGEARRVGRHGVVIFPTPQAQGFNYDPSHHEVKGVDYAPIGAGYGLIVW